MNYEVRYQISKFFANLIYPFRSLIGTIGRFFYWGWVLRNNQDWDYWNLYYMLLLKLKRMRTALKNGFIAEEEKEILIGSLDKAIHLCSKLVKDDYSENVRKVEEKWGDRYLVTDPSGKNMSTGRFFNGNAITPKEQKKADLETMKAYKKDELQRTKDRIELFKVIQENIIFWWD